MIDIKGIDKAELLAALHNGTRALGIGIIHDRGSITAQEAQADLDRMILEKGRKTFSIDYYHGRPLKVYIFDDEFEEVLYDRDAGKGAAKRIVDSLRRGANR